MKRDQHDLCGTVGCEGGCVVGTIMKSGFHKIHSKVTPCFLLDYVAFGGSFIAIKHHERYDCFG